MPALLDLDAYFARINYTGSLHPTLDTLNELHLAHLSHIPFENLDIQLGRSIAIDLPSLQMKLIHAKRGGYCFEQNTLFAEVLRQIGFNVTPLSGRVRRNVPAVTPRPRTHMVLRVELDGYHWLADLGFGGEGLLLPIRFDDEKEIQQYGWSYRLLADRQPPGNWLLQIKKADVWHDLYVFTLEPQLPIDFEMANYYVSTHPDSRFVQTLTAQRATPLARYILINRELTIDHGNRIELRTIAENVELLQILQSHFGLIFPAGTQFPIQS